MGTDQGFKKAEGFNQDDEMKNPRGQVGPEDHGWAPDAGEPSEAIVEAGRKSFQSPEEQEASQ